LHHQFASYTEARISASATFPHKLWGSETFGEYRTEALSQYETLKSEEKGGQNEAFLADSKNTVCDSVNSWFSIHTTHSKQKDKREKWHKNLL
jgi:hypothetical protein